MKKNDYLRKMPIAGCWLLALACLLAALAAPAHAALTAVSLVPALASPRTVASAPFTLQAQVTGTGTLSYQFLVSTDAGKTYAPLAADYQDSASIAWTPGVGSYLLKVQVKDAAVTPAKIYVSPAIAYQVTAALTGVTLATASVTLAEGRTLVPATKKILLTANAGGGAKNSYRFYANGVALAPASVLPSTTWAPAVAGNYDLTVQVLDANGATPTTPVTSNTLAFTVTPLLTAVTLAAAPAAPRPVNTAITLTATATGGTPDAGGTRQLLYQFLVDGQPLNVNYTADATGSWTPSTAKSYTLAVRVKDPLGADPLRVVASPAASYPVTTALGGVTLTTASVTMTEGRTLVPGLKKILLTASAGGAKNSYQFFANGKALAPASVLASTTWAPAVAGDYDLTVQVLDANGAAPTTPVTSNTLAFTVAPPLAAVTLAASPAGPRPVNTAIALAATATGGTPDAGGTR